MEQIKDEDGIIIIDDDIWYRKNIIKYLVDNFNKDNSKIYCYCLDKNNPTGFSGWIGSKKILKDILKYKKIDICYTIDDDFIGLYLEHQKIKTIEIPYEGSNEWYKSMDQSKTDEHPEWSELNKEERSKKQIECRNIFKQINN
jgi:hypothetical protein